MKDNFTTDQILDLVKDTDTYREFYNRAPDHKMYQLQVVRGNTGDVWVWACENYIKPHSKSCAHYNSITKTWTLRKNRFIQISNV